MVSAIHQHESAIGTRVSPPSWIPLPLPSHPIAQVVMEHQLWVPCVVHQTPTGSHRRKALHFSSVCMKLAVILSHMAFLKLRHVPSLPTLLSFIIIGCWISSNGFYASLELTVWLYLSFSQCGIQHWFVDVEIYLDPWNKPHGVVYFSCFADFGLLTFFFEDIFTYIHQE